MATSRTGTAKYRRNRARVIHKAKAEGLTHCQGYVDSEGTFHPCGVELDYDTPGLPNSAEVDHIVEARFGVDDSVENLRVLCRRQNSERNRKVKPLPVADSSLFPCLRNW